MLARKYMEVQAIIRRWSRRYDERLLEQLIYVPEVKPRDFERIDLLPTGARELETRLNARSDGRAASSSSCARPVDGHATAHRGAARPSTACDHRENSASRILRVRRVPAHRGAGAHARRT